MSIMLIVRVLGPTALEMTEIQIPYTPRPLQAELHKKLDEYRWSVVVCHRRFGKTVCLLNHLLRAAILCTKKSPRFHYLTASYKMAKQVAWDYMHQFAGDIPGVKFNETELRCDLPNGARIQLLGGEDEGRLRGIYSDGIVMDEMGLLSETLFTEVIRAMLVDRQGWCCMVGTPQGHNLFYDYWQHAESDPDWYRIMYKASETNILPQSELDAAKASMNNDAYRQEFECSFEAATPGSVYGKEMQTADEEGRITTVPYDPTLRVNTHFDLGINDATSVIFTQQAGRALHVIDCFEARNEGLPFYARMLDEKGYLYGRHYAPHDIEVREMGSGKSRREVAYDLGINFEVIPKMPIEDGIHATKMMLARTWFDREKCHQLLEALRFYHRVYDPKNRMFRSRPKHDWSSHFADCARYTAQAERVTPNNSVPPQAFAESSYNPLENRI